MAVITSPRNPLLKDVRKAIARGTLTADGYAVAESFHLLEEALRSAREIGAVFVAERLKSAVEGHVRGLRGVTVTVLPDDVFEQISGTESSQGVLALVRPKSWSLDHLFRRRSLVLVLDGVQDPGNAGTMIRCAEAFSATGVAMLKGSANPYNPKSVRASAGSIFRVPVVSGIDELLFLSAVGQREVDLYCLSPHGGTLLHHCPFHGSCAIVVGSEGRGVSERVRNKALDLRIPTAGVESLNAALAAGIALYEARKRRMLEQ